MLTKTHLKYRLRAGCVLPAFVATDSPTLLQLAEQLIDLFTTAAGQTAGELDEAAVALADSFKVPAEQVSAFVKLLHERCETQAEDEKVAAQRWQTLLLAQQVRQHIDTVSPEVLRERVAQELEWQPDARILAERLYADLPALKQISSFEALTPRQLLERYNCALVQGLLLQARSLRVKIAKATLTERRSVFRMLKFHRLMAEVEDEQACNEQKRANQDLLFNLSGPLSLFEQAQTYGLRLATFFPHLLHLPAWQIEAELFLKKKNVFLKLDQKTNLVSPYQKTRPFVPDELVACVGAFNEQATGWSVAAADEFVHIGKQSYCFPDLTLRDQKGRKIHIELFHRWHVGQLAGRLAALDHGAPPHFFVGISKTLQKNPKIGQLLQKSEWFTQQGFVFGEFPTPKHLNALIKTVDGASKN